jgi:hypothetical protein
MVVLISAGAVAQMGGGPGGDPSSAAMQKLTKVYGNLGFSATAVMTVSGQKKMPPMSFEMAVSAGKTRMEMDMAKMMAASGEEAGQMPAAMGKMVTISLPEKKITYQIMPNAKAYCEMPLPDDAGGDQDSTKVERQSEGEETVEGHACEKVRNTVTSADGKTKTVVLTWEAKDLKGFPIKSEVAMPDGTATTVFKNIKMDKPADSLFEPPAGYTKHASMQAMMMSAMMGGMPTGQ